MINPYKRTDIFKCNSTGHEKFEHRVSVYHVLRIKKCYPQGCIYFKWHCRLLNKGQTCSRGYKHVGRKCFGCKHYYDEKINNQPSILIDEKSYARFLEEIDEFEDWLNSLTGKVIDIEGVIQTVKPALNKTIQNKRSQLHLNGFFIHFSEAFIDTTHWEDRCYAFIHPDWQKRHQFAPGDQVEFRARIELDRGRLVFKKVNSVTFLQRSGKHTWNTSEALIARHTTISLDKQHSKCVHCQYGMLVDVIEKSAPQWERSRDLICLKAVSKPRDCLYHIEDKLIELADDCPEP